MRSKEKPTTVKAIVIVMIAATMILQLTKVRKERNERRINKNYQQWRKGTNVLKITYLLCVKIIHCDRFTNDSVLHVVRAY